MSVVLCVVFFYLLTPPRECSPVTQSFTAQFFSVLTTFTLSTGWVLFFHLTLFGFRGYLSLVHNLMFYLYFSLELKHCICVACFTPPLHFLVLKTFSPLLIRILTCHINEPQRKLNPNNNDIIQFLYFYLKSSALSFPSSLPLLPSSGCF